MRIALIPPVPRVARLAICCLALAGWTSSSPAGSGSQADPPDEHRFTRRVLVEGLDEPMQMEFDPRGRVYLIERRGSVKRFDEATGQVTRLGTIPVFTDGEGGLLGILLDERFETTRHLYLYYTATGDTREARLSRFTLGSDDRLDMGSEVVVLRWPHDVASHMGGGMTWDPRGSGDLYLSTGGNSAPTQYTPIHWTNPGGAGQDAQRTSANTNDLRGKILRIRPQPDGTYTIPEGNLFPPGTPGTRPEIYTMGNRNPWRLSIDARTGYLHWGEIGPDAGRDSAGVGPRGYDEFNVARSPGNYGWPYFIGYNRAYHRFDYDTGTYGPPFDPDRPVNASPNNTGLRELPPARPPLIAYPYGVSEEFPMLSSGGRAAVGGPVFRRASFGPEAERPFDDYYEGKWFITDFVRSWIMVVTMSDDRTQVRSIERFLPDERYNNPMDLDFGPEGDLYVVEYAPNSEGRLSRIEYNAGNLAPRVTVDASRTAGATPLRIALSSEGTVDHDDESLRYEWVVTRSGGGEPLRFTGRSPEVTLREPGVYRAELTVTDPEGAQGSAAVEIVAGNEPPQVALELTQGNRSFYFPDDTVQYRVSVRDEEDGSLASGIPPARVHVTAEYVPRNLSPGEAEQVVGLGPEASVRNLRALRIVGGSDCAACHSEEARMVGPSFREVAEKYAGREDAVEYLAQKIISGGSGVWGQVPMPPHPSFTPAEAALVAQYVMSLGEDDSGPRRIPPQGRFATTGRTVPGPGRRAVPQRGSYVLRATYTDQGAGGVAPITSTDVVLLRYPHLAPETADVMSEEGISYTPSRGDPMFIIARDSAFIGFRDIDLTGIDGVEVGALTRFWTWSHFLGATLEVRLGSPTGRLVGSPVPIVPPAARPPAPSGERGQAPAGQVVLGENLEPPVRVDVSGISGVHDLYFVFRNREAGEDDALLLLTGIGFRRADAAGSRPVGAAPTGGVPEGFTALFNGRDLTGWHVSRTSHQGIAPEVTVEDGVLVLKQNPYGQGGVLLTDRSYRDFELYLEVKPDWGTNGGIFFRSTESGSAYQVELAPGTGGTGNLLGEMLRVARGAKADGIERVWKDDDWNAFRLRVAGEVPRMTLWVNGEQMWDVVAERNDLIADATRGMIGLQVHWSSTYDPGVGFDMSGSWKPGAAHRFRNIAIRELDR